MNGDTKYKVILNAPVTSNRNSNIIQNLDTNKCNWIRNTSKLISVLDGKNALSWDLDTYLRSRNHIISEEVKRRFEEAEVVTGRELRMAAMLGTLDL